MPGASSQASELVFEPPSEPTSGLPDQLARPIGQMIQFKADRFEADSFEADSSI